MITATTPRVFQAMGTAVSLAGEIDDAALAEIRDAFEELEQRFSLYRPDSEASRLARRELVLTQASAPMREAYELAATWRSRTGGAFTPHRPDGVIDLSGVVKALAIRRAGEILDAHGSSHWCVNAGGDILTRTGEARPPWVIGVVDPADRTQLLTQFTATPELRAFATSGIAERGEHIWRIGTWDADADPFVQVSVAAADIVTADVLATAVVSGGRETLEAVLGEGAVEGVPGGGALEAIAISRAGELRTTAAFRA